MKLIVAICIVAAICAIPIPSSAQKAADLTATLPNDVRMEFVQIPPGEFTMGCSRAEGPCTDDELPAHVVRITRGFQMGKYEVTSAQWQAVMVRPPFASFKGDGDNHAVGFVGWDAVQDFLTFFNSRKDGHTYRLPSEAEWEYAARAGTKGLVVGSDANGWFGQNVVAAPQLVGQKRPNAWGLYDMQGNAWEWTQDFYSGTYYANSPQTDPKGPATGQYRVLRGGSSFSDPKSFRLSLRHFIGAPASPDYYGFRVVREPIR